MLRKSTCITYVIDKVVSTMKSKSRKSNYSKLEGSLINLHKNRVRTIAVATTCVINRS